MSDFNLLMSSATHSDAIYLFLEKCFTQECAEKTNVRSNSILFVVLLTLTIISSVAYQQIPQISQTMYEIRLNAVEELKIMAFH